jgi:hypothetical protein
MVFENKDRVNERKYSKNGWGIQKEFWKSHRERSIMHACFNKTRRGVAMTKNQVNYLLALATLVVVWLYFNTFSMLAMVQKRNAMSNRAPVSMAGVGEATSSPRAFGNRDRRALSDYLAEIKKRSEAKMPASAETLNPAGTSRVVRGAMKSVSGIEGGGPVKREFVAFSSTTPVKTGESASTETKVSIPVSQEKKQ